MTNKILIIDDDARIHSLVRKHLERQDFELLSAYDGQAGIAAGIEQKPDAILLDVDLQSMQGFEVCRQLKANRLTKSIPIIFLTGSKSVESRVFGLECGANDYLTKPFHPSELQARVRAALRTKSQLEETASRGVYDDLTNMFDRRYFDLRLDSDLAVTCRTGRSLGCMLIDIDNMDLLNTWFGRPVGDDVLKKVGESIQAVCRREDVVCRFEEDEFAALISDTDSASMADLSERARVAVRGVTPILEKGEIQVTASVGFALSRFSIGSSIVNEAQEALNRAKAAGGDCVEAGKELVELRLTA